MSFKVIDREKQRGCRIAKIAPTSRRFHGINSSSPEIEVVCFSFFFLSVKHFASRKFHSFTLQIGVFFFIFLPTIIITGTG